jgi:hypothetical protein
MNDNWIDYITNNITNFFLYSYDIISSGINYIIEQVEIILEIDENINYNNTKDELYEIKEVIKKKKDWMELKEKYRVNKEKIYDSLDIYNNKSKDELINEGYLPLEDDNNHMERFFIKDFRRIELNMEEYKLYNNNLMIISSIKENEKISINNEKITISSGYISSMYRYLYENRNTNYEFIKEFYNDLFKYLEKIKYNKKEYKNLKNTVKESNKGLKNIKLTYKDDEEYVKKINIIILKIEEI